jgi:hypothetical protein
MPYNPGVYDRSGEIMGNAYANMGNIIGGTLTAYSQKREQNKLFDSKSKSVEALIKSHADDFGLSKEQLDAYLSKDPGETPQARYERLSGLIDNAVVSQKMKQFAAANQKMAREQEQGVKLDKLSSYMGGGMGTGVLSPEAIKRYDSQAADPYMATAARLRAATGENPNEQTVVTAVEKYGGKRNNNLVFPSMDALQKKYPTSSYEYNFTENPDGSVAVIDGKISGRAPGQSLIPAGFEPDPARPGAIRPIKGSEADIKRQEAEAAKVNRVEQEKARADVIINSINNVLPLVDTMTAGAVGKLAGAVPGTPAYDVASTIDTIKANIGFEQLQQMRNSSPTGGALGQVAVKELDFLQAALGNLNTGQSPAKLKETLQRIRTHYTRWAQAASGINPDAKEGAPSEDRINSLLEKYR